MPSIKAKSQAMDDLFDDFLGEYLEESQTFSILDAESWEDNEFPVTVREFIDSKDYLNMGNEIYPQIKELLSDVTSSRDYRTCYLEIGRDSGKSVFCSLLLVYRTYLLCRLKNPQKTFKLQQDTELYNVNVSTSGDQAKNVIFAAASSYVSHCPAMSKYIKKVKVEEIEFNKRIHLACASSAVASNLGYAMFTAICDESNFMKNSNGSNNIDDMTAALEGGLIRCPDDYLLCQVSSAAGPFAFLEENIKIMQAHPTFKDLTDYQTSVSAKERN